MGTAQEITIAVKTPAWKPEKWYAMPPDTFMVRVVGDCMDPAIRDGQLVFVHSRNTEDIALGTPVLVTLDNGERLIKSWGGVEGGHIALHFLNDPQGKPGTLFFSIEKIVEIWIVAGIWFDGVPFKTERPLANIPIATSEQLWESAARNGKRPPVTAKPAGKQSFSRRSA